LGAAPLQIVRRGEEVAGKVEGRWRPVCLESDAVSPCDVGEPVGGILPADEDDAFDFRPDRRQRRADTVAAVEQ